MTNQAKVLAALATAPGTASDIAHRTGLSEPQVRRAIESLRREHGYGAVLHQADLKFALGRLDHL